MIEHEGNVAAVIIEPIVGTNGVLVPPKEYMPKLRALTKRHGVLLIADEVMTGWGRTGNWFAVDHGGADAIVPDILTTAKGITSAYVPLGLCATTDEIADYFDDHYFAHGHTYEAHPLTLAPAMAAIHEYKRLGLIERSRQMGEKLGAEAARAHGEAPVGRRRARPRPLLGGRAGQGSQQEDAVQHAAGEARRQAARRRSGDGEDDGARRLVPRLDEPPRDRAAAHHHRGGARRGPARARRGARRRRRRHHA